ncbi:hypothetical protein B0H13DRAFT_1882883 [Mycena leptocephala]|nr:hypothetical protein B0H13DRAFT_1882883 [Mycena leptocephala]
MVKFMVVPIVPCSSTVGHFYLDLVEANGVFAQATVDGGSETGERYAAHVALRQQCMPDISLEDAPCFVPLENTDNIPIKSLWHLFTNYVGFDIKQITAFPGLVDTLGLHVSTIGVPWSTLVGTLCLPQKIETVPTCVDPFAYAGSTSLPSHTTVLGPTYTCLLPSRVLPGTTVHGTPLAPNRCYGLLIELSKFSHPPTNHPPSPHHVALSYGLGHPAY